MPLRRIAIAAVLAVAPLGVFTLADQTQTVQTPPIPASPLAPVPEQPSVSFEDWLAAFKTEALSKGISEATFTAAFAGVQPNPLVITRDRAQPELTRSLDEYI